MALKQNPETEFHEKLETLASLDEIKENFSLLKNEITPEEELWEKLTYNGRTYEYYEWLTLDDIVKRHLKRIKPAAEQDELEKQWETRKINKQEEKEWLMALDKEVVDKLTHMTNYLNDITWLGNSRASYTNKWWFAAMLTEDATIDIIRWDKTITLHAGSTTESDKKIMDLNQQKSDIEKEMENTQSEEEKIIFKKEIWEIENQISEIKKNVSIAYVLIGYISEISSVIKIKNCDSKILTFKKNKGKIVNGEHSYFPSIQLKHVEIYLSE